MNKNICKEIIDISYRNTCGFLNEDTIKDNKHIAATYGEYLFDSIETIIDNININKDDIFVDLGSGLGKIILHMYLRTPVKYSIGVEGVIHRYKTNINILSYISNYIINKDKYIFLLNMNIYKYDFSKVTILFINGTCFDEELLNFIEIQVNIHNNIKYVISNRKFDNIRLELYTILCLKTTWNDYCNTYIYN